MINRASSGGVNTQVSINKAATLYHAGKVGDAIKICRSILRFAPKDPDTNHLLAQILIYSGDVIRSWSYLKTAILGKPLDDLFKITYYDGLRALFSGGKLSDMESEAIWLTEQFPDNGFAFDLLGAARLQQKKYQEAFESLYRAQNLLPNNAHTLANYGYVLMEIGRNADAVDVLQKSISIEPTLVVAHNNLGNALRALGDLDAAIVSYKESIRLQPNPDAHSNLGISLREKKCFDEAIIELQEALRLKPDWVRVYANIADAYRQSGRLTEALDWCRRGLALDPDHAPLWACYGDALREANELDAAIESFIKALSFPVPPHAHFQKNVYTSLLFSLNYHPDLTQEVIFEAYKDFDACFGLPKCSSWTPHVNAPIPDKKLKVAYLSHVFYNQVCKSYFMPLLEGHNRENFEIYAYANPSAIDDYTERYKQLVDHWVPIRGMSDEDLERRIRDDGIDILIDVAGHTPDNRLSLFARKPAPVSLHWLEFGYTTGLSAIDYYLTDRHSIPAGGEKFFAEKPWFLDGPGYVYRPSEGMGEVGVSPAERNNYVTFGTLTRGLRINYKTIAVWSAILRAVPNSRLVMNSGSFKSFDNQEEMAQRFVRLGVARDRLQIGFHSPPWDVLREIDIGLDCFPHNSGATLIETLYMGSPFVTLQGRPSVGCIGASILHAIGHPEWIAQSEQEYIDIAVSLAADVPVLANLRSILRSEMKASSLMNEAAFVSSMEKALRQMWIIYCDKIRLESTSHLQEI